MRSVLVQQEHFRPRNQRRTTTNHTNYTNEKTADHDALVAWTDTSPSSPCLLPQNREGRKWASAPHNLSCGETPCRSKEVQPQKAQRKKVVTSRRARVRYSPCSQGITETSSSRRCSKRTSITVGPLRARPSSISCGNSSTFAVVSA